jgi:hypothetical protein
MLALRVCFLLLFASLCHAYCAPSTAHSTLTKGEPTFVCLLLQTYAPSGAVHRNSSLASFTPKTDTFSRIVVDGSYASHVKGLNVSQDVFLQAQNLGGISLQKRFKAGGDWVFPQLTMIVSVSGGKVVGISWDDGCYMCPAGSAECQVNAFNNGTAVTDERFGNRRSCGVARTHCDLYPASCDLTVYVSWQGTDKNGDYLKSSALRFSQFRSNAASSYWSSMKDMKERVSS